MAAIILPRNDALNTNPPAGDQYLTVNGSDWLYTVCAIYTLTLLVIYALSWTARAGERFFHYLFIIALFTGAIAYWAMASDLAWSLIRQSMNYGYGATRQIFFAKYVNWVVSFPVVILALGVLSGVSWTTMLYQIGLSWVWIIGYLVAAYTTTNYKWGFFAFGTLAYIALAIGTLFEGMRVADRTLPGSRDYALLAGWTNLLWLLYPIAWGLSDGGNRIGLTASFIFFGILDVLLIPVLAYSFIILSRRWDYNKLNIAFTQYGRVRAGTGTYPEKEAPAPAPAQPAAPAAGGVTGDQAA
ncbi:heat shock protein 30 [Diplogelasinospora grovesii]|uniref:Heat shock protein 30 n=1 Tax=Diplogelasinospora grovesii TaxID=303347 RepID=A0AAN6NJU1_9PEZI|nr:heat shock protein 30 [Diplogelasinospora grovesii]